MSLYLVDECLVIYHFKLVAFFLGLICVVGMVLLARQVLVGIMNAISVARWEL